MNFIGSQASVNTENASQFSNASQNMSEQSQSVLIVPESFAPEEDFSFETQSQTIDNQQLEVNSNVQQNLGSPIPIVPGPIQAQIPVIQLNVMEIQVVQHQTPMHPNELSENPNNSNHGNLDRIRRRLFELE